MATRVPEPTSSRHQATSSSIQSTIRLQSNNNTQSPPTDSHFLAETGATEFKNESSGRVTEAEKHRSEVQDLGWNKEKGPLQPLATGLSNGDLWTLVRRFNKQVFRVRRIHEQPLTGLDMNDAAGENIAAERLRAHMERVYMIIVITLYSTYKHIVRIRLWREKPRTASFLTAYSIAWLADSVVLTLAIFLIVLITYPPARAFFFPPVPAALINSHTGGVQTPYAGKLASDSITGASETRPGQAIEQEAHSFMMSMGNMMMSVSSGKHPQNDSDDGGIEPDPADMAEGVARLREKANAPEKSDEHDATKEPVDRAVSTFELHAAMRILPHFIDNWERIGNALSPTPPFPTHKPRLLLAACLLPPVLIFYFATWNTIMKGMSFCFGFGFFGSPIITACIAFVDRSWPNWRELSELRHTVLRGVPTNVQLATTLLRLSERSNRPLPPAPDYYQPSDVSEGLDGQCLNTFGGSKDEIQAAIDSDSDQEDSENKSDPDHTSKKTRLSNGVKRVVKSGLKPLIKISKTTGSTGGKHANGWLGALQTPMATAQVGPIHFPSLYQGENGDLCITTATAMPTISWRMEKGVSDSSWTVQLDEITELSKIGGLGWKTKLLVGWVTDSKIADGLLLKTTDGKEFYLATVTSRNEVFNRVLSIGNSMWEVC